MKIGNKRAIFSLPESVLPFSCRYLYPEGTPRAVLHIIPGFSTPLSYWFGKGDSDQVTSAAYDKTNSQKTVGHEQSNAAEEEKETAEITSDDETAKPSLPRSVIQSLVNRGILVCGFDPQGIGETVDEEYPLGRIAEHGKQVEAIRAFYEDIRKTYRHLPYIMMGYGIGSLALREYIARYDDLDGAVIGGVLTGDFPLSTLRLLSYSTKLLHAKVNRLLNGKFAPELDNFSYFSTDENERRLAENAVGKAPNLHKSGYLSLFRQIELADTVDMNDKIPLSLPLMIASGENDPLGGFGYAVNRLGEYLTDREMNHLVCRIYRENRHAIADFENSDFQNDLCDFVETVITGVIACRTYENGECAEPPKEALN